MYKVKLPNGSIMVRHIDQLRVACQLTLTLSRMINSSSSRQTQQTTLPKLQYHQTTHHHAGFTQDVSGALLKD